MRVRSRRVAHLAAALILAASSAAAQNSALRIVPNKITMGPFYDGASLHIEGTAPAGSGVIIVVRGSDRDQFFNRKSRLGPVWLNSDRIHIQHCPSVFLSYSSGDVGSMLNREALDRYQLDEVAILHRLRCRCRCKCDLTKGEQQTADRDMMPSATYRTQLESEFRRLKEDEGLYCMRPHSVNVIPDKNGRARYTLDLQWPAKIPPGTYEVDVCICSKQEVIARSTRAFDAVETGLPAYILHLALSSPEEYGIETVLAALIVGFATDLISTLPGLRRRKIARASAGHGSNKSTEELVEKEQSREAESSHLD